MPTPDPGHVPGYDGTLNDYFLIRTARFTPCGALSGAELAADNISGLAWWDPAEIIGHRGPDRFSPRDLGNRLTALLTSGVPPAPIAIGR
ncbi:hypothetical protein [Streptomyces sp. CA-111067]|uniref:hypothetical protein n=1 Tax=Streptomyces sp. CA-111067 TaxID=3240046 RepID=UPI003D96C373